MGEDRAEEDIGEKVHSAERTINLSEDLDGMGEKIDPALLEDARNFVRDCSIKFQDKMRSSLDRQVDEGQMSETEREKFIAKGYDLPVFKLLAGKPARELVDSLKMEKEWKLAPDSLIMVFDFPKPVSRFWKLGKAYGEAAIPVQEDQIRWGELYDGTVDVIRGTVEDEHWEDDGLFFDRLNADCAHKSRDYYYVWEVSHDMQLYLKREPYYMKGAAD